MHFWKNVRQTSAGLAATPDLLNCKAEVLRYRLPLKKPLRSNGLREGLILQLACAGRFGYGDIAPLPGFSIESLEQAQEQLVLFCRALNCGRITIKENYQLIADEALIHPLLPCVAFGIESALWWLQQRQWLKPPTTAPLLQGATRVILERLRHFHGPWPNEFKLKIGCDALAQDIDRINAVLRVLPEQILIKLDANRQWTLDQALQVASVINRRRISYIEEPTAHLQEFSELFAKTGIRFALDESIQRPDYQFKLMPGLAAIIIKPTLVGGLERCRQLVIAARDAQVRAIFSSSYESAIGLKVLQQLSAQWTPEELPGLDTARAFKQSLIDGELVGGCRTLFASSCIDKVVSSDDA